jgi:hypothetical protein
MGDVSGYGSSFSPDHPIERAEDDEFDRQIYVSALLNALQQSDDQSGLVVGISGPWGSGKTSLKNMLIEKIQKCPKRFHVVEFEPWMYSGSGKLVSLLFREIADDLSPKRGKLRRCKERTARCLNDVLPVVSDMAATADLVVPGAGTISSSVIKAFAGVSKAMDPARCDIGSLSRRREKLRRKLKESQDRIIVFIDDLDRLMDDEVAEMLRAVKAVGDLPHVIYVLLYDRDSIDKSLDKTYHGNGSEYLEKIIQVPLELPTPPRDVVSERLKAEILAVAGADAKKIYGKGVEQLFEPDAYDYCVEPYMKTMRNAVRLANEFKLRYMVLKDDVEIDDLLNITSLEVFRPSLHRWIMSRKAFLCSPVRSRIQYLGVDNAEKRRAQSLGEQLQTLSEPDREVLGSLFPFARATLAGNWSNAAIRDSDSRRSIFKSEHFDAYFRLSIDRGVLHEAKFKQFLLFDDLLAPSVPDENQLTIFNDRHFPDKAASYLGGDDPERIGKVIAGCLKCDQKSSTVFQCCVSINVVESILNRNSHNTELLKTVTDAIAGSDSIAAVPAALALAIQIQKGLHVGKTVHEPPLLPQSYDLLNVSIHPEDSQPWKDSLDILKQKILSPFPAQWADSPMPFDAELLGFCFDAVPYLYGDDGDRRTAFESLRRIVHPNQYPLFVVAALTTKTEAGYVPDGSLLPELVTREQYRNAVDALIREGRLWDYAPLDREAVASYQVALDRLSASLGSPSQSSFLPEQSGPYVPIPEDQARQVVDGWVQRVNEAKSSE